MSVSAGLREEGTKEVYNAAVESDASGQHADKKAGIAEERSSAAEDAEGTGGTD